MIGLGDRALVDHRQAGAAVLDQHVTPGNAQVGGAMLLAGWNRLLVKVSNTEGRWAFVLRLTAPDGRPLAGLTTSADPPSPDWTIPRAVAYADYADLVWCETGTPDLEFARKFAEGIHKKFPGKMLSYNCSPSFNWKKNLDESTIAKFQRELGAMGYKYQFITLAGFHSLNYSMFNLAHGYARNNMSAFVELQEAEFAAAEKGFTAVKHQREVGTGYFDAVTQVIQGGQSSTTALHGSTEDEQFFDDKKPALKLAVGQND